MIFFSKYNNHEATLSLQLFACNSRGLRMSRYGLTVVTLLRRSAERL